MKIFGKFTLILFIICCKTTFAQVTYVEGFVISSTTSWPIAYANIKDEINLKGVSSDSIGNFKLPIYSKNTLLHVSCVGFENTQIRVKPNSFVVTQLKPIVQQLAEITIKPKENPAWEIIRRTLANANNNNPLRIPEFKANHYSKIGLHGEILKFLKKSPKDSLLEKEKAVVNYCVAKSH